jgi:hypothetical protein
MQKPRNMQGASGERRPPSLTPDPRDDPRRPGCFAAVTPAICLLVSAGSALLGWS